VVTDLEGHAKPLTEDFASSGGVAWSAQGEEIWFTAGAVGTVRAVRAVDRAGRQRIVDRAPADLWLADVYVDGRALVVRHTSRRGIVGTKPGDPTERDLSWLDWSYPSALSPDGVSLLFTEQGQGGGADYSVYMRKTDGSPAVRLGTGNGVGLSRDGRWAIASSLSDVGRIDFLPVGTGEVRTIHLPGMNIAWAAFLPGDKRLLVNASEAGQRQRQYVVDATGGTAQPITPEGIGFFCVLSPDDARLAVNVPGHVARIVPIAGGDATDVPGSLPDDEPTAWSADGRALYVSQREGPAVRVDRIDLGTGRRAAWKTLVPADRAGVNDVGFLLMAPDARAYVYSYRRLLSTLYHVDGLR
jgi:Tol biopolymer transport system component